MPLLMSANSSRRLLYPTPFLLNGLLYLIWYVKEQNSHYTQIAQGLGLLLLMLLLAFLLNGVGAGWALYTRHYGVLALYGVVAVSLVGWFILIRNS